MRRNLLFLTFALALSGLCQQAKAAWRETTSQPISTVEQLLQAQYISLEARCNASATGSRWVAPNSYGAFDGSLRAAHVFKVVVLPTVHDITGEPQIQLQEMETGKWYYGGDGSSAGSGFIADTQEEASILTVGQATKYTSLQIVKDVSGDYYAEDVKALAEFEWQSDTKTPAWDWQSGDALTFGVDVNGTDPFTTNDDGNTVNNWDFLGQVWGTAFGYTYCWVGAADVNPFYAYEVEEYEDYYMDLQNLVADHTSNNYATILVGGTTPGCYGEAEVAAYMSALDRANELLAEAAPADEDLQAATTALREALTAVLATEVPMRSGYYYIMSAYPNYYNQQQVYKAMYDNGTRLRWMTFTERDPQFLFKFEEQEDGTFSIQNMETGNYVNGVSSVGATNTATQTLVSLGGGQFNIRDASGTYHTESHSSGAGSAGNIVSWSGGMNTASSWSFTEVTDQVLLDSMIAAGQQTQLTMAFENLLAEAVADSAAGYVTKWYITSVDQLSTNAAEPTGEGPIANLIDGDNSTYFHTSWSANIGEPHYLQVTLADPLSEFAVYWRKRADNNNNRPTAITVLASTDGTNYAPVATLPQAPDTLPTASTQPEYYSSSAIQLGGSYQYIRFQVDSTSNMALDATDGDAPRNVFFTFAEFNLSEAGFPINEEASVALRPDMVDVYAALATAIQTAQAKDPATITQADIDELSAAIEAFNAAYPDTTLLSDAISECAVYATAQVAAPGAATMGYVTDQTVVDNVANAVAAARAALDANPKMTRAEIDQQVATLEAAREAFMDAIVKPEPNKWYYIQSVCSSEDRAETTRGTLIYPANNSVGANVMWGDELTTGTSSPKYLWRFVPTAEDNVYAVQNFGSGYYLGEDRGLSQTFTTSDTIVGFRFEYVADGELSLIQNRDGANIIHAQASGTVIVPWTSGAGGASSWTFVEISEDEQTSIIDAVYGNPRALCLPYDVTGAFFVYDEEGESGVEEEAYAYEITDTQLDENGNITAIGISQMAVDGVIPAGTPFILLLNSTEDAAGAAVKIDLGLDATSDINMTPLAGNGLVGVMTSTVIRQAGLGYFSEADGLSTVAADGNATIDAQSAYIEGTQVVPTGAAEVYLTVNGGVITEISNVVTDANAVVNVYATDGKLVRQNVKASEATKGLAAGLYVVGNKVVVVK